MANLFLHSRYIQPGKRVALYVSVYQEGGKEISYFSYATMPHDVQFLGKGKNNRSRRIVQATSGVCLPDNLKLGQVWSAKFCGYSFGDLRNYDQWRRLHLFFSDFKLEMDVVNNADVKLNWENHFHSLKVGDFFTNQVSPVCLLPSNYANIPNFAPFLPDFDNYGDKSAMFIVKAVNAPLQTNEGEEWVLQVVDITIDEKNKTNDGRIKVYYWVQYVRRQEYVAFSPVWSEKQKRYCEVRYKSGMYLIRQVNVPALKIISDLFQTRFGSVKIRKRMYLDPNAPELTLIPNHGVIADVPVGEVVKTISVGVWIDIKRNETNLSIDWQSVVGQMPFWEDRELQEKEEEIA